MACNYLQCSQVFLEGKLCIPNVGLQVTCPKGHLSEMLNVPVQIPKFDAKPNPKPNPSPNPNPLPILFGQMTLRTNDPSDK